MSKKVTTTERFDASGKLIERVVVTEETEEDPTQNPWTDPFKWKYSPSITPCVNTDPTRNCPCRPENGGSGVCGCVLGGPQVTCSA